MEIYTKHALSIAEQVRLAQSRGLDVGDHRTAETIFEKIGYYRLSGYWYPFKQEGDRFENGATLEQIVKFYEFDRKFRLLVLNALEKIEIHLRTLITEVIAHDFGPFGHENSDNFRDDFGTNRVLNSPLSPHEYWIEKLHQEAQRSSENFIKHYQARYTDFPRIPIWMAVEIMSFGTLSKCFQGLRVDQQRNISKVFNVHHSVLHNWIHSLSYVRNVCAHHSRLWNRALSVRAQAPRNDDNFMRSHYKNQHGVYLVVLILRHLTMENLGANDWAKAMVELLKTWDSEPRWLNAMGMPVEWKGHPFWEVVG